MEGDAYASFVAHLPEAARAAVTARWGPPEADPSFREGGFAINARCYGNVVLAVQPSRGGEEKTSLHDGDLVPPHGYLAFHAWLRAASPKADITMSVCTGAFQLAKAGLLDGKEATTHHDFTEDLASRFPNVKVKKGLRFVEGPHLATAGVLVVTEIPIAALRVDGHAADAEARRLSHWKTSRQRSLALQSATKLATNRRLRDCPRNANARSSIG